MELLKLNFDINNPAMPRTLTVEIPYQDGNVATSEFCPTRLMEGSVDLMAAVRGVTLDRFVEECRRQALAMSRIEEAESALDRHIGALMAVVVDHLDRETDMQLADLLTYTDCFSLLLKADSFGSDEVRRIYPEIVETIMNLYPDRIKK